MTRREAIVDALNHWKRMRDDPSCGETPTGEECALCDMYRGRLSARCIKCPLPRCDMSGSPYLEAINTFNKVRRMGVGCEDQLLHDWQRAADKMIRLIQEALDAEPT